MRLAGYSDYPPVGEDCLLFMFVILNLGSTTICSKENRYAARSYEFTDLLLNHRGHVGYTT